MPKDIARSDSPIGIAILVLVIAFGGVQLFFWTDRSIWIDEVSQLLNFPLDNLAQAFGPLPQAQQAGPPVFNLFLHSISHLSIQTARWIVILTTLGIITIAMAFAFDRRPIPIAAGLFVLLSQPSFLINGSMLKFYAFDAAGFAIFTAWIYCKNRDAPFGLRDMAVLFVGLFLGLSTIVAGCLVVALFLLPRLKRGHLEWKEVALAALFCGVAVAYYLQIGYATKIQLTGFPDAYGALGFDALKRFGEATMLLLQTRGVLIVLVLLGSSGAALIILGDTRRSKLVSLLLFTATIVLAFLVLAAIGKYPAVSSRHLFWILGVVGVLAGAVVDTLLVPRDDRHRRLALGCLIVLGIAFAASGLRVAMKWPPQLVEGSSDQVVETLANLPPSDVLYYFGTFRLIPLMIERGAPIAQHRFAPSLSTQSGAIDPSYFDSEWNEIDGNLFSEKVENILQNDPIGWAKMYILLRQRSDFRPLARFVLDSGPSDGRTFYIASIHASWPGLPGRATAGLRQVLDERSCSYKPVAVFDTLLSPGYVLEVNCPPSD